MILFSTPRLTVKHYTIDDAENFILLNTHEDVMKYIRPVVSKEETEKFFKWNIDYYLLHENIGRFAVYENETGNFAGSFSLLYVDGHSGDVHIGYAFLPAAWGRGYATEVTKAGMDFFFEKHVTEVLYGIIEAIHTASKTVLIKCGFQQFSSYMENEKEVLKFIYHKK